MSAALDLTREWLEADGLGGFASGTAGLARTRRYHALLLAATKPPAGRVALVAGFDAFVLREGRREAISAQSYEPGERSPDGAQRLERFETEPWPTWTFRLSDGACIVQQLFATEGAPRVVVTWRLCDANGAPLAGRLVVRPFLAGRDYHALAADAEQHPSLLAPPQRAGDRLVFAMPPSAPAVEVFANAEYVHAPHVYRGFHYAEECDRGFAHREDLASPGELTFDLAQGEACWVVGVDGATPANVASARQLVDSLRHAECTRRAAFATPLERAADAYVVRRGGGETIVAGYPWFTDWGRDTFIALRGLCLATGRLDAARRILLEWAGASRRRHAAESLRRSRREARSTTRSTHRSGSSCACTSCSPRPSAAAPACHEPSGALLGAVDAILCGYARGTRLPHPPRRDGLLAAGEPGVQLTWMDARIGDRVVTPRIGKPAEIQALWWNALVLASAHDARWKGLAERAHRSFSTRFWNHERGFLYDVVDADHVPGAVDASFRPNQIFAIGGLPYALLEGDRARRVIDAVERALWTPLGLRSLAPSEPGYAPRYEGGPRERDGAYHQGTVWPWLLGAFVEAWLRVRGDGASARAEARVRFLAPLYAHLEGAGLGHVSEIADGDAPHTPRGCPFQAWSLAELLRLERGALADPSPQR